ncbi:MAG: ABC transporter substrate-binding protein [Chloroflexota bacterium]
MPRAIQTVLILLLVILISACGSDPTPLPISEAEPLPVLHLFLGTSPSIKYAPFYAAEARGFFKNAGIDVRFEYGLDAEGIGLVGDGEIPFAISSGEQVLLARDHGLPVITILGWYRDTPIGVLALESQGLDDPDDLAGMRIGLPDRFGADYLALLALLNAAGLSESDINLDTIGYHQIDALLAGDQDAVVGDIPSLSIQFYLSGNPVEVIPAADSVQLASFGLVANQETIDDHPDLVHQMVQAVKSGIRFTITHPDEAFELSEAYVADLGFANAAPQMDILEASIKYYQQDPLGYSSLEAWQNTQAMLLEMGLLTTPLDLSAAFSNDFIRD